MLESSQRQDIGAREMLRHTLATLAYRGRKAVLGAPEGFRDFRAAPGRSSPTSAT